MAKKKLKVKDPKKMTDKQLLHDLFPKEIIKELKAMAIKSRKKSKVKFHRAK
jgi:hypothetical protein